MTFKTFEKLFHQKYPDGKVWKHDEFCHGQSGKRNKVAVEFNPNSKVYMYTGAYEDILSKVGIDNVISKERFAELVARLEAYKRRQKDHSGKDCFFGVSIDYSKDIHNLEIEIDRIKKECIIA